VTRPARLGIFAVRAYQVALAPFAGGACRFHPSCSAYAIGALAEHGLLRGAWLACRRVARCHPLAQPGIDPVPPRVNGR
jgi:putative membrane protein insertion efficiency factor